MTEGESAVTLTAVLSRAIPAGFEVTVSTAGGFADPDSFLCEARERLHRDPLLALTFAGTENETATFTVPIVDDGVVESPEASSSLVRLVDGDR